MKSWLRYCQNTKRKSFKKSTFSGYYGIKNMNTQDNKEILGSAQKRIWALLSTPGLCKYSSKGLWVPVAPWHHAFECFFTLMTAVGAMVPSSWLLMDAYECSWMLMSAHGCLWVLKRAHKCSLVLISAHGTMLKCKHGCSWAFMTTP